MSARILFLEDGLCGGKEGAFGHIARTLIYQHRHEDFEVFYYESETNTFTHLVETGFKNIVGRNASHLVFCLGHELLIHPELFETDFHALPIFFKDLKNKIDAKIHVINFPEFIFETGTVQHTNLIQLNQALLIESQRHDFHYIDMNSICMDFMKFQQSDQATVHRSLHHDKATLNALGQQFYTCGILDNEQFIFPKKGVTL